MKKEAFLCGFLAVAGMSADVGLNSIEAEVRDAVSAALSSVSATAQDIRFSLLEKTLVITGLEYALPKDGMTRKGRIERVELTDFDGKVFTSTAGEPYDPQMLPKVAEKAVFSGWNEEIEEDGVKMTLSLASYTAQGWYQRLGLVFGSYAKDGMGQTFFEEMLRCRIDAAHAENMNLTVLSGGPDSALLKIRAKSIENPGGMKALSADGKPGPVSSVLKDISFESGEVSGAADMVELADMRIPTPAQMLKLQKATVGTAQEATEDAAEDVLSMLAESYAEKPPFSRIAVKNLNVWLSAQDDPVTLGGLVWNMNRAESGAFETDVSMKALHIAPGAIADARKLMDRYAPEGLTLDMRVRGSVAEEASSAEVGIYVHDLGRLELGGAAKGNAVTLIKSIADAAGDEEALTKLLAEVDITKANVSYQDTGFIPLAVNAALDSVDAIGLDGLDYAMNYVSGHGYTSNCTLKGLHVGLELLESWKDVIVRYAPDGLTMDATTKGTMTDKQCDSSLSYVVRGLGMLDAGLTMQGDMFNVSKQIVEKSEDTDVIMQLLSTVKLTSAKTEYQDSGLLAMALGIASKELEMPAKDLLGMASGQAEELASGDNAFYAKLGAMLKEQILQPGKMSVSLAPNASPSLTELISTAVSEPAGLPLVFSSTAGSRTMEDYLK
ncbi:MAG: hypothetical protein J6I40_00740 [Mailhella sp.]|nr:hypothetical protein [Mailhella sp.]